MANNPYVNKVVYGNQTVMDISDSDVQEGDVVSGKTFYKASGQRSTGSAVIPDISNCYQTTDTAETTIDDADYFPFYDTSATAKRKSLWSNIKSVLKTYFDAIYLKITQKDTFSAEATQANGQVQFFLWFSYETDPNATDYGFELWYSQPLGSSPVSPTIPKWTSVTISKSEITTGVTINLTYAISGGTNGTSKYRVRILK